MQEVLTFMLVKEGISCADWYKNIKERFFVVFFLMQGFKKQYILHP